jgi:hypothetical protein
MDSTTSVYLEPTRKTDPKSAADATSRAACSRPTTTAQDGHYPLEHLLEKSLPMHRIVDESDLRQFAGQWVVVESRHFSLTHKETGIASFVVGHLSHQKHTWAGGICGYDLCLITYSLAPFNALTPDVIRPGLSMRSLSSGEQEAIRLFMNQLNPRASYSADKLGRVFALCSYCEGRLTSGDQIFRFKHIWATRGTR